ncbi:hypothetical protein [Virgisporangium aurantiacum]|uniref:Uncharacterized protein n=1 Tax=Virgisporangium aurantiacum TaxID=175570 RepID=A0A8J3Z8N7_9ACTN|nr:hypothetical protein [Virgisporangium aurantiacum]GIJ57246.1 hypothetical protein Vau01_047620 [Virgisporangium aurantiacum]
MIQGLAQLRRLWFNTAVTARPAAPPPLVTVLAILLYIGGGLVIAYAVIDMGSVGAVTGVLPAWGQALYGALYVALARALQIGSRRAWLISVVLCWAGLALAGVYLVAQGLQAAIAQGIWAAVYLTLLTRSSVREWCAARPTAPGETPTGDA